MKYQETGRFGRITKNVRNLGYEKEMEAILLDSLDFTKLKKIEQTQYIETVMDRMEKRIGLENTNKVLFECGAQCCGKSWSNFVKQIWQNSKSIEDFIDHINQEEEKYDTHFIYNEKEKLITVVRDACICGLINKGNIFTDIKTFCNCSIGHMSIFFNTIFKVDKIEFTKSIYSGDEKCEWIIYFE